MLENALQTRTQTLLNPDAAAEAPAHGPSQSSESATVQNLDSRSLDQVRKGIDAGKEAARALRPEAAQAVGDAKKNEDAETYDFVIAGSGPGGIVAAEKLARAGYTVCILEQGGNDNPIESRIPAFHAISSEHPKLSLNHRVRLFGDDALNKNHRNYQKGRDGQDYFRGESIGGSSNINALVHLEALYSDWQRKLDATGDKGWDPASMSKRRVAMETANHRPIAKTLHRIGEFFGLKKLQNIGGHGYAGWLQKDILRPGLLAKDIFKGKAVLSRMALGAFLADQEYRSKQDGHWNAIVDSAHAALRGFDPNDTKVLASGKRTFSLLPHTVGKDGTRQSARELLTLAKEKYPDNITIKTDALVLRANIEDGRSKGLDFVSIKNGLPDDIDEARGKPGSVEQVNSRYGTILTAGTLSSPKILMHSGIGDKDKLAKVGIAFKVHNPHVGEGSQDRYEVPVPMPLKDSLGVLQGAGFETTSKDSQFRQWIMTGTGTYVNNGIPWTITRENGNMAIIPLVGSNFRGYQAGYSINVLDPKKVTFNIILRNRNRDGSINLRSGNPFDATENFLAYFPGGRTDPDLLALVRGIREVFTMVDKMGGVFDMDAIAVGDIHPNSTDDELIDYIFKVVFAHHINGSNADAVETDYSVTGVPNLYILDASAARDLSMFPMSELYLAADKVADDILAKAGPPSGSHKVHTIPRKTYGRGWRERNGLIKLAADAMAGNANGFADSGDFKAGGLFGATQKAVAGLLRRMGADQVKLDTGVTDLLPKARQEFLRGVKLVQAALTKRDVKTLSEGVSQVSSIKIDAPDKEAPTFHDQAVFFQRWDTPEDARRPKTGNVVLTIPPYEGTGRNFTKIADKGSRRGDTFLCMDSPQAGYSAGVEGRIDGEIATTAAAAGILAAAKTAKKTGGKVTVLGESYGAGATVAAAVLHYNKKLSLGQNDEAFPDMDKGELELALINPFFGRFAKKKILGFEVRPDEILGNVTKALGLDAPIPTLEAFTNVYDEADAEKRFNAIAALDGMKVRPSALSSGKDFFQNLLADLESGKLKWPPGLKLRLMMSEGEAKIDQAQTARLVKVLGDAVTVEELAITDHALALNWQYSDDIARFAQNDVPAALSGTQWLKRFEARQG